MLLKGLGVVFEGLVGFKNHLYDRGFFKQAPLPVKVISVGNLSVGGTGKTSFVIWLLKELKKRGVSVGVVSRGYGGTIKEVAEVPPGGDPTSFGDEPCLIANEGLGPVFIGPKRVAAAQKLLEKYQVQVILADDAFQHRALKRDVDVVLIDVSQPVGMMKPLPHGRLREGFSSLSRADAVVITKQNFAKNSDTYSFVELLLPSHVLRLSMNYLLKDIEDINGKSETDFGPKNVLLVSGVAGPDGVYSLANKEVSVLDHMIFPDHHSYTKKDVEEILKRAKEVKADFILVTPKDAVKLHSFDEIRSHLRIISLDYSVEGQVDEFFKKALG